MEQNYTYKVIVNKVIDADTLAIDGIDLGFGIVGFQTRGKDKKGEKLHYSIRLFGVDAPETKKGWWSKNLKEDEIQARIQKGEAAKKFIADKIAASANIVMFRSLESGPDNFGRFLGDVYVKENDKWVDLAELLKVNNLTESKV